MPIFVVFLSFAVLFVFLILMWNQDAKRQDRRIKQLEDQMQSEKESNEQLLHKATHDRLTGLPNRMFIDEGMAQLIEDSQNGHPACIVIIDLDNFKDWNDVAGYAAGDEVLASFAARCQQAVKEIDVVCRWGGDEFVVMPRDIGNSEDALRLAERLNTELSGSYRLTESALMEFELTLSIGVAWTDQLLRDPMMLFSQATLALQEAKRRRPGRRIVVYEPQLAKQQAKRLELQNTLREAVRKGQYDVTFMPIVNPDGTPAGVEALVSGRWQTDLNREEEMMILEQIGATTLTYSVVLRQATKLVSEWNAQLPTPLRLSVNISARQLEAPDFAGRTLDILRRRGFPPRLLVLELTERQLLHEPELAIAQMDRLTKAGVAIELDDFETGQNSRIRLLQIHQHISGIKIDKSFVGRLDDPKVLEAVSQLVKDFASTLDLGVTAEGVETIEQAATLSELGCHYLQGYLYAPPQPAELFAKYLGLAPTPRD